MDTIFAYSPDRLPALMAEIGQPAFRAKQLTQWLYHHGARSYDDMTNLPKKMRAALAERAPLVPPEIADVQVSKDGTRKFLLRMADGALVETVAIPSRDTGTDGRPRRLTVCFSTQVGCPMACAFCATGQEGLTRNLLPGEMAWQLIICEREMGQRVSNAVAMGQGEPFLNYDNVIGALRILNSKDGLEIGARHISVSTCGILRGIERFGTEPEQFTLAVSLHSAQQKVRNRLMPKCAGTSLEALHDSLVEYHLASGRRASLEYLMIKDVTDTDEALDALVAFCDGLSVHVNLLPINKVDGSPYAPAAKKHIDQFVRMLGKNHVEANLRDSRGADIDGACGQLKNKRGRTAAK